MVIVTQKRWNSGNFGAYFGFGILKIRTFFGPIEINTLTPNFDNFVKIALLVTEFFMINRFRQNSIVLQGDFLLAADVAQTFSHRTRESIFEIYRQG